MSKVQSKELTAFYRAYKQWLDDGAFDGQPFFRSCGLCANVEKFVEEKFPMEKFSLGREMTRQFQQENLNLNYPFGYSSFMSASATEEQHLDPLRIKWVEDHLKPEFIGETK